MLKDYAKKSTKSRLLDDASNRYNDLNSLRKAPKARIFGIKRSPLMLCIAGVVLGFGLAMFFLHSKGKLGTFSQTITSVLHSKNQTIAVSSTNQLNNKAQAINNKKSSAMDDPTQNLALLPTTKKSDKQNSNQRLQHVNANQSAKAKTSIQPKFEFYRILAQQNDNTSINTNKTKQAKSTLQSTQKNLSHKNNVSSSPRGDKTNNLTLYVASFQDKKRLSPFRARLILLGLAPLIKTVSVNGKKTYRVLLGPFQNEQALNRVKTKLGKHDILIDDKTAAFAKINKAET